LNRDRSHLAKALQPRFGTWLWDNSGLFIELLDFLTNYEVPDKYKTITFQRFLVLYSNNRFKQLKIETQKIKNLYLALISSENPRPFLRDKFLDSWLVFRNISENEFERFLEVITQKDNPEFGNASLEVIKDRVFELVIRDEAFLLAMMARVHSWIAEIDTKIEFLNFRDHTVTTEQFKEEITRDDLDRKYHSLNKSLSEFDGLSSPILEFHFPPKSWKNRWRRPF
jgi:hypothetical protein